MSALNNRISDCYNHTMDKSTVHGRIYTKALELLEQHPEGLYWSELTAKIEASDPGFHPKTVNGCVWKLVERFPEKAYKPSKGLFACWTINPK
jgi:hypothetical protein